MKTFLLVMLTVAVYALHQDFWNFKAYEPLVFGFVPIGLAYHAGYSVLCAVFMYILVKFAWPEHLELAESEITEPRGGGH